MNARDRARGRAAPTATVLVGVLAAACGGIAQGRPAPATGTSALRVGLAEYTVTTTGAAIRPGSVRLVVTNAGSSEHDLEATQGGRRLGQTRMLRPGEHADLLIDVAPGRDLVRFTCTVPGHDTAGMHTSVQVAP